jgi:hypothetical protein
MKDKLREAFQQVRAEDELKRSTRAYLYRETRGYARARRGILRRALVAAACFVVFLLAGSWVYLTPTVAISIDINPSIELGVNRFDRVVSATGYNEDGEALLVSLDLRFLEYSDAVSQILQSETVVGLLSDDQVLTIVVVGDDEAQSARVLSDMQSCTEGTQNAHCYSAHSEEVEAAHDMGLSYGKYQAYLELQALDPTLTPEQVQGMTMREIRELLASLSGGELPQGSGTGEGQEHGESGSGHGHGNGHQGSGSCE